MINPRLSIIIPTYNECENINPLLEHLHAEREDVEVIVVDSAGSTDGTLNAICYDKVVKLQSAHSSRAIQMDEGARLAKADTLYFVHADTRPPQNYMEHIESALNDNSDFGLFSYRFDSSSRLLAINSSFTRKDGVFAGGGDQSFFIRKATYHAHGGFDTSLPIMEDFDFYWRLKEAKVPFKIIPEDTLVSARKYEKNSYIKVQLVNLVTLLGFKYGRDPVKLKRFYMRALG
jgi:rSAM/selenodomain-associated transferase 2